MPPEAKAFLIIYLSIVSIVSIVVTVYDKRAAVSNPHHRIRERSLFWLAALGGSAAMYLTMKLIRHKTKHKRFMIGIPLILFAQTALGTLISLKLF